jgi:DNA-binding MarR family transcriptional regulator
MDERARTRAIALILELADQFGLHGQISPGSPADPTEVAARRLITAKAWQRASRVRREFFEGGGDLFADPAWEILIELYIEQAGNRRVMVSNACIAAQVPTTTGLRWLDRLFRTGLITRMHDGFDRRIVYVALSEGGLERMEVALDAAIESDRKLGLGRLQWVQQIGSELQMTKRVK